MRASIIAIKSVLVVLDVFINLWNTVLSTFLLQILVIFDNHIVDTSLHLVDHTAKESMKALGVIEGTSIKALMLDHRAFLVLHHIEIASHHVPKLSIGIIAALNTLTHIGLWR